ncbi:hypothetical protein H4V95_001516 [Arthrobacter sp. CAN_C5]|nr:hypothetical protein [Arthrobacter sp. CAN_C5]
MRGREKRYEKSLDHNTLKGLPLRSTRTNRRIRPCPLPTDEFCRIPGTRWIHRLQFAEVSHLSDPPPGADAHPPEPSVTPSHRVPSRASVIEVLRRPIEFTLGSPRQNDESVPSPMARRCVDGAKKASAGNVPQTRGQCPVSFAVKVSQPTIARE